MDSPNFEWADLRFLNEHSPIHKSRRQLPHWQQDGKTYFVTFRLKDSIPTSILHQWKSEKTEWLSDHPLPWSPETEKEYHTLFSAAIDRYLDQGMGSCLLKNPPIAKIVSDAFQYFHGARYILHTSGVMPNHVHVLLSLKENVILKEVIASWKRFTANTINKISDNSGQLWMNDHFDRMIRDWDHFINVCRYIRNNPAKAEIPDGQFVLYLAPWVKRLLS